MPGSRPNHGRHAPERAAKKVPAPPIPRAADGKFLKGVSGNPSGVSSIAHVVREFAGAHSVEALEIAVKIMRDPKADKPTRLAAARTILDRAVGKAAQPITGLPGSGLVTVNVGGGGTISPDDAMAAYLQLVGNPTASITFTDPAASGESK